MKTSNFKTQIYDRTKIHMTLQTHGLHILFIPATRSKLSSLKYTVCFVSIKVQYKLSQFYISFEMISINISMNKIVITNMQN